MVVRSLPGFPTIPEYGSSHPRTLFVAASPPRECGIATVVEDVRGAYDLLTGMRSDVIAINDPGGRYAYPECVVGVIDRDDAGSYRDAAGIVNDSAVDVVNIQHEYGLFGGERGSH